MNIKLDGSRTVVEPLVEEGQGIGFAFYDLVPIVDGRGDAPVRADHPWLVISTDQTVQVQEIYNALTESYRASVRKKAEKEREKSD